MKHGLLLPLLFASSLAHATGMKLCLLGKADSDIRQAGCSLSQLLANARKVQLYHNVCAIQMMESEHNLAYIEDQGKMDFDPAITAKYNEKARSCGFTGEIRIKGSNVTSTLRQGTSAPARKSGT